MIQKNRFFRRTLRVLEKKILSNSAIVKKIDQNTKNEDIENKIPDVSGLVTTAALIAKTIEIEYKILDITNLASKAGFNARSTEVKNKIPDITNLANKAPTAPGNRLAPKLTWIHISKISVEFKGRQSSFSSQKYVKFIQLL